MLSLPCAKINIGLNVVGVRLDGYHDLETLFYPVPLTDVLEIDKVPDGYPEDISIEGMPDGSEPKDNLAYRVYSDMRSEFALPPMSLYLRKKIPCGSGLGGGSSDAAETMKLINDLFQLGLTTKDMQRRVSRYGADCAFFITRRPAFATGIGDVLEPADFSMKGKFIVIVKPQESVSTREAYAGVVPEKPKYDLRSLLRGDMGTWRGMVKNDFEESVFPKHPEIRAIKDTLYDMGAEYASMSGSGSAVYGLFSRPAHEAENVFKDCFVFSKQLLK